MLGFLFAGLVLAQGVLVSASNTDAHCVGNSSVLVYLAEWTWQDIAAECPRLAKAGYCGVQTSNPTEHVKLHGEWWERKLQVSFKLDSRSGNESDFREMVKTCNEVGIRIYPSLELNHMASSSGQGFGGTTYNGDELDFPGVPFNSTHFHTAEDCMQGQITALSSTLDIQRCWLANYPDLDQANLYVQKTIVDLLNLFIDMGVAGFHLEDALYIAPEDIGTILEQVDDVFWGGRPFVAMRVYSIDVTKVALPWFLPYGRVEDIKLAQTLGEATMNNQLDSICEILQGSDIITSEQALVYVDDTLLQRTLLPPYRKTPSFETKPESIFVQSVLLASGHGLPRVMSSYKFTDRSQGPPLQADGTYETVKDTQNGGCSGSWVCEHRWLEVESMVDFRNKMQSVAMTSCKSSNSQVTFQFGDDTFFFTSIKQLTPSEVLKVLPQGIYHDIFENTTVLSSELDTAGKSQMALTYQAPLPTEEPELTTETVVTLAPSTPMKKLPTPPPQAPKPVKKPNQISKPVKKPVQTTKEPTPKPERKEKESPWKRTVIFIKKSLEPGESVFIRGGKVEGGKHIDIPIKHNNLGFPTLQRDTWAYEDDNLNWSGREHLQTWKWDGQYALGTPAQWTTSDKHNDFYHKLNKYGSDYWMVDVEMDCSKTSNGMFELRGVIFENGKRSYESKHSRASVKCKGGKDPGARSQYHYGQCGKVNVFVWETTSCTVANF